MTLYWVKLQAATKCTRSGHVMYGRPRLVSAVYKFRWVLGAGPIALELRPSVRGRTREINHMRVEWDGEAGNFPGVRYIMFFHERYLDVLLMYIGVGLRDGEQKNFLIIYCSYRVYCLVLDL